MQTPYTEAIKRLAPAYDAGQVEAFMRVEHSTLDALSQSQFRAEVTIACACIDEAGPEMSRRIAESFGLVRS